MSLIAPHDKEVYADHAAFSPVDRDVLSAMLPYYEESLGNPSSLHSRGRHAKRELENARARIASTLSAKTEEIIFTSGGTEANNLALVGTARANRASGSHIIISSIEHPSVMEAARSLESEGFTVERAPVLANGQVDIRACLSLVRKDTILISVMYVNNEIGTIQPIRELSDRVKATCSGSYPLLHTDACQAGNVLPLSPKDLGVDLMTINSTKLSGPGGIGVLYKREGVRIEPLLRGGEQEGGFRAGTESVPLAAGFSLALTKAQNGHKEEFLRLKELRDLFIRGLEERVPNIRIHGGTGEIQSPAIIHVTVPCIEGEAMLLLLDSKGIHASTGSACASLRLAASHVLTAIGHDGDTIHGSIRFSFGRSTTKDDIDYILGNFPVVTERLLSMTALKQIKT